MQNYENRLQIPIIGNELTTFTTIKDDIVVATGYERIVIGKRGPYIEFSLDNIFWENFHIPDKELWRVHSDMAYYVEYRTQDNVKLYEQCKTVDYADYKIDMCYISPFDLKADNKIIIESLR